MPRSFELTLLGNIKRTITLDIPAETPLDQVKIPGLKLPLLSLVETTSPSTPSGPLLSIKPTAPAQGAPAAPASPAAEAQDQLLDVLKPSKKKKGKPSVGQPVFDSAGRLLSTQLPERERPTKTRLRHSDGVPTLTNPALSLATLGPVPVGVPNFFINKFRIPPFLLSIYQAAGIQYGVRWEVLAAINEIETDYGRNLNVSSAGAMGWMQFIPSSWKSFGVDANGDGKKDPYNPVDAIFAAARYLKAAGADQDLRKAIFAYNHADWYVDSVLMRARFIGGMPSDLIGSLSGLTQGLFPVHATAKYADDISERDVNRRVARGKNAALPVEGVTTRRGINIFAKAGSPVVAVQDGKIVKVGQNKRLGNFVMLRDVYGNTYTYAGLKKVASQVPVPKKKTQSKESIRKELALPKAEAAPTQAASAGSNKVKSTAKKVVEPVVDAASKLTKERLFANPTRPNAMSAGGKEQLLESESALADGTSIKSYFTGVYGLNRDDVVLKSLVPGRRVIAGTILGRIGTTAKGVAPHTLFEIRPAGRGAPRIDPKPILDGWKLLESTAIYRAQGKNPFFGEDAQGATVGQILLMSKDTLIQRVLANPRIELYSCGRRDVAAGVVDRRVLATLEFLASSGLKPTVTSLRCGHGFYTAGGNVSAHSSGNAVDIAKINGIPIMGNQGGGSITDIAVRRMLTLQGTMQPAQIITLMTYEGAANTLAMGDHADHIHVGFRPQFDPSKGGRLTESVLKPSQWIKLIDRLGQIDNPTVKLAPSKYAIKAVGRASRAHKGD
ncbi:MAG: lytic murein transglycosylase [Solirubrobacteraceae bacterium]|nr:lytic murein transglycosylase [Solirubrobacteraceae bacterium]